MRKITILIACALLLQSGTALAQMSGDNIFLPGRYVKVAIAPNGSFGSTVTLPSGYYYRSPSLYIYDPALGTASSTSARLAMVYDAGHDGWTSGSPAYFGDYTLPGTPYEGWQLEINGSMSNAWYQYYQSYGASGFSGTLSGNNTSYTNTGGQLKAVWQGTAGTGGTLAITQTTTLDTAASWIWVTTTFRNTGSTTLNNVYYQRAFDPDNDQTSSSSFNTTNTINYQNDAYHRVMVTAAGTSYTTQTVSLATKDCRAKCFSTTSGWPTGGTSLSSYFSGSGSGSIYSGSNTGDNAIGLVFKLGNIAAGDSTSISYAFIFNGTTGVDSAYTEPLLYANGVMMDSIDTVAPCSTTVDTVFLSILNGRIDNWSRSTWRWSPSSYLLHDTGISNGILLDSLTAPITYTITGTDTAYGRCSYKVFYLTAYPAVTPLPGVADIHYCLNATPVALTATGSGLTWYTTATGGTGSATAPVVSTTTAHTDTFYVSQTLAGCPGGRARIIATVDNIAGPISGPSAVCVGSAITLTNDTLGGTWSATPSGIASVDPVSGVVGGLSGGTVTVSYTRPGGCYVYQSFTVNPLPAPISGPAALCIGATGTWATASTGGNWTTSNAAVASITATGSVTAVSSGTARLTYTLPTGCQLSDSIVVNALPTVPTGGAAVCAGSTVALSATPSGGVWSSSSTAIASVDPTSGLVYGTSAGTANITYTVGTGCYSLLSFTVNPLPLSISGPGNVCEQASVTLSSGTTGGNWSSSNVAVATVNSAGVAVGVSRGSVTITYTNSTTSCYTTQALYVDSLPDPFGGPAAICQNFTGTLTDAVPGGTWSTASAAVASIDAITGVAYGVSPGTVSVEYTLPTGCLWAQILTVNPAPAGITGPTAVCAGGGTITLVDSDPGGTWSTSAVAIASVDAAGTVTGVSAGSVFISYTFTATGCPAVYPITVNPLPAAILAPGSICLATSAA
ncbi:MAG: hypothetical protein EBZ77_04590, partial [Chitinophagia bacterium]|nr:hypothetical protein [Chitinophagia bacterium]